MRSVLTLYVLAFAIFNSVRGEPLAAAATNLEEVDEKDESNDFGMQDDVKHHRLEIPILKGHSYPFCKVRYQACKVAVNDECKCKKLAECCKNCFRSGVFCRALPEVCLWVSLRCQCQCLSDASDRSKRC